jgi:Protein of unknown function (DUF3604)
MKQDIIMSLEIINNPQAHCTMMKQFTWHIVWRPEKCYVAGSQIEVRSQGIRAFASWRFTKFKMKDGDISYRCRANLTADELFTGEYTLFRARLQYGVKQGEPIEFEITGIPPVWAGIDTILSIWTIDIPPVQKSDAIILPEKEESECTLSVVAGPVERFSIYSWPAPGSGGKVRTVLVPEDRFGNPACFEKEIECELEWNGKSEKVKLKDSRILQLSAPNDTARATVTIAMENMSSRENINNGCRDGDSLIITGNPVWPECYKNLCPAFGEFHWHTDYSQDGQRPLEEALRSARDYLNMNFAAPGDHNPCGELWQKTVEALNKFNSKDEFATFFGWENASDRGHENYYFTDPNHPLICGGSAGIVSGRPDDLAEKLLNLYKQQDDFITIPHHTNSVAETRTVEDDTPYWHPYPWLGQQEYIPLVEIMQTRGNQEANIYDDAWRGWHQNNGSSVQDALALGCKMGFVGGTDNHCGWPGRVYAESEVPLGANYSLTDVILTGVWTPAVERQAIFDSLKARHTWAVWNTRAIVWFAVNNTLMGGELNIKKGDNISAYVKITAEDSLQSVEIISDKKTVWNSSSANPEVDFNVDLGKAEKSCYFYLRALQRDGGIIYASPIFITVE